MNVFSKTKIFTICVISLLLFGCNKKPVFNKPALSFGNGKLSWTIDVSDKHKKYITGYEIDDNNGYVRQNTDVRYVSYASLYDVLSSKQEYGYNRSKVHPYKVRIKGKKRW